MAMPAPALFPGQGLGWVVELPADGDVLKWCCAPHVTHWPFLESHQGEDVHSFSRTLKFCKQPSGLHNQIVSWFSDGLPREVWGKDFGHKGNEFQMIWHCGKAYIRPVSHIPLPVEKIVSIFFLKKKFNIKNINWERESVTFKLHHELTMKNTSLLSFNISNSFLHGKKLGTCL